VLITKGLQLNFNLENSRAKKLQKYLQTCAKHIILYGHGQGDKNIMVSFCRDGEIY